LALGGQLLSIYILAIPLSSVFAFKLKIYVAGLWLGLIIGMGVLNIYYWILIAFKIDFR
jgi:hypothetical protein